MTSQCLTLEWGMGHGTGCAETPSELQPRGEPAYTEEPVGLPALRVLSSVSPPPRTARPPPSGLLTKLAGACLVEEQAHGDVPARRPAHGRVAGLGAFQRIPGETSI